MAEIKIEKWAIDRVLPYDKNAKIHTQTQVESLAKVIKSQGWDVPIVVDKDGMIIKGHGRRLAAIHLGMKEVPVICRRDLSPAQVKAARLSDNRVALTDFDATLIKDELASLNLEGFDVSEMGFDQKELDMLLKDMDTVDATVFEAPESASDAANDETATDAGPEREVGEVKLLDLVKVLGFKNIPDTHERAVIKFMSYAESMTGMKGELAFVEFAKKVVAEIEAAA